MKKGFTLAEVLITLAIIGVVAAMTVPTLMTSTRGKEYEVAATKAMSTIANALQMRYAMEGQSLYDYMAATNNTSGWGVVLVDYLTRLPANARPGEKPALQVVQTGSWAHRKLPDGQVIIDTAGGGGNSRPEVIYILIDTNGEKGPTRVKANSLWTSNNTSNNFANPSATATISYIVGNSSIQVVENNNAPTNNTNPDIVIFAVDTHTGSVKPAGQRTRNIMATGNALISQ